MLVPDFSLELEYKRKKIKISKPLDTLTKHFALDPPGDTFPDTHCGPPH